MSWKRRLVILVIGAMGLMAAYRGLAVYEVRGGECTPPLESRAVASLYPRRLLVMTYNIEGHAALIHPGHLDEIAATIARVKPDIVGLNEVHRRTWQSRFTDQVARLRTLTGMNAAFGESYQQLGGQFGNAILTRGEIISNDIFKLPGTSEPRTLLDTVIRIDGAEVEFFVTHLTSWDRINQAVRADQLECISRHLRASRRPRIFAGDLNADPDAGEIRSFRTASGLQLTGETLGPTQKLMKKRIDYLFADPGWRVAGARVLDIGPSDHRPVIAELIHE